VRLWKEPVPAPATDVVHNLAGRHPPGPTGGYLPGMPTIRTTDERLELGRLGEALAAARLEAAGLRVVAHNWRCREGEIDLVAAGPGLLVFCEVKTRRGHGYGSPAAAVTYAKQARLRRLAAAYLAASPAMPCRVRFDVVAVTWPRRGPPVLEHLEGAF
jgi:putative endonuclease